MNDTDLARSAQRTPARLRLLSGREKQGGGKVENLLLVFHFSIRLVVGAVEMWESRLSLARFPRGSWKEGKACLWLSTLSTAPAFPQRSGFHRGFRQRANKANFAFCMRRAASVSLRDERAGGTCRWFHL